MDLNSDAFNSSNVVYINSCRTCLKLVKEKGDKKHIFEYNITNKIKNLTSINLREEDGLSNFICNACNEKLNNAVQFKDKIATVNEVLNRYLNNIPETESFVSKNEDTPRRSGRTVKRNQQEFTEDPEETSLESISDCFVENEIITEVDVKCNGHFKKLSARKNTAVRMQNRTIVCPTCNKRVKSTHSLKAHLRTHGVIEKKPECDKCGKKYTNQYDLRVHSRKHSGIRPFSCNDCQKTFADQRCFEKHKKIHSGEKLFKCELCDKSFIHSYTLKTHLRVHSGEKPFICAKCGHSFTTTTQLKLHTRIHHTREKPYSCELCPKVFVSSSGLSNHRMTHTGERKFICSVCGKGSRTTSDLKCHLRTHTGERPFICTFPDCEKKYKTNSQLCTHIRTHTGEQN